MTKARKQSIWPVAGALLLGSLLPAVAFAAPSVSVVIDAAEGDALDFGWGIALDSSGNLLVAGHDSDNVLRRTPSGVVSEILGPDGDGVHPLNGPTEITVGADGSIYVVGQESRNVFRKPPGLPWVQILDSTGDGAGNSFYPGSIAVDGSGNVFVTSGWMGSNPVFKVTPAGAVSVVIDETGDGAGHTLDGVTGVGTDAVGNLYVAGSSTHNVFQVTPAGVISELLAATPSHPLPYPRELVVEADGTIYVTTGGMPHPVYRRDPDGTLTELSNNFYGAEAASGPSGTLLVSTTELLRGFREDAPACTILDITGNGSLPRDSSYGVVTAPGGVVYATGRAKVYRIDGACGVPADYSGHWLLSRDDPFDPESPPETLWQTWIQSGFDLTVTESFGVSYTGTIDDAGNFELEDDSPSCQPGFPCCPHASVLNGTVSPDGNSWDGVFSPISWGLRGCAGPLPFPTTATRVASLEPCDDSNTESHDGCDASGLVEPCWSCEEGSPDVCSPEVRICASGGGGGASLRATADTGRGARMQWKLPGGPPSTLDALGDPTSTTTYELCVFDRSAAEPAVLFSARVAAGDPWKSSSGGFSLKQRDEDAAQGITRATIKAGDKTKAIVKGAGPNLVLPSIPVPLPLTVQLRASDAGCFEASYSLAGEPSNADGQLKAKADPSP